MSVVGEMVEEMNKLRAENAVLREAMKEKRSLPDEIMHKLDLLITLVKRNGS